MSQARGALSDGFSHGLAGSLLIHFFSAENRAAPVRLEFSTWVNDIGFKGVRGVFDPYVGRAGHFYAFSLPRSLSMLLLRILKGSEE